MNRTPPRSVLLALPVALLLAASVPAAAQEPWRITARGGVISADPDVSPVLFGLAAVESSRSDWTAGVGFDARCSGSIITRVELMYTRRAAELSFAAGSLPGFDATYTISHLDMPVTVKFTFGKSGIRPFLAGGGVFSFILDAEQESDGQTFDIGDQIGGSTIALTGGLGIDFRVGDNLWLQLEGRYLYGLTDLTPGSNDEWHTRDLQGLVGFGYDF